MGHVTIYDVAVLAGVSIGTVSRALNDQPQVSKLARQAVLQAASELRSAMHPDGWKGGGRPTQAAPTVADGAAAAVSESKAARLLSCHDERHPRPPAPQPCTALRSCTMSRTLTRCKLDAAEQPAAFLTRADPSKPLDVVSDQLGLPGGHRCAYPDPPRH